MPTNLPPECQELEDKYRAAKSLPERIAALEAYIGAIPKHKGTDHLRADLRRKLSKLKDAAEGQGKKGAARQKSPYSIDREGGGQVVLVGTANTGKSALVAALTHARPEVSPAPLSTWSPTPGMMPVGDVQIQLIDTPSLNREFIDPDMVNLLRRADLLLVVVDVQTNPVQQLEEAIDILYQQHIVPQHQAKAHDDPQLTLTIKPMLVVVNKTDDESIDEVYEIFCQLLEEDWPMVPVSAESGRNLEHLKQAVFEALEIMRIYSKAPGEAPDMEKPYVLKKDSTVEELAEKVHRDFYENLKSARVWGSGAFDGQPVARDHVLQDGDVVELRI